MQPPKELKTINGYVEPLTFGSYAAQSAKVAVVSDDGNTYVIMPKGLGTELALHMNALVEVRGEIKNPLESSADEGAMFHVQSYNIRDGYDDAWYDEE